MEILIHIEKKKLDIEYAKAVAEYVKRLSAFCRVKCIYYKDFSRLALSASSARFLVVPGKDTISSEEFASKIEQIGLSGISRIEFIIQKKSFDVLSDNNWADSTGCSDFPSFSLSGFTMSPDLTTVVLTEQLYRAYTILNHITYHK